METDGSTQESASKASKRMLIELPPPIPTPSRERTASADKRELPPNPVQPSRKRVFPERLAAKKPEVPTSPAESVTSSTEQTSRTEHQETCQPSPIPAQSEGSNSQAYGDGFTTDSVDRDRKNNTATPTANANPSEPESQGCFFAFAIIIGIVFGLFVLMGFVQNSQTNNSAVSSGTTAQPTPDISPTVQPSSTPAPEPISTPVEKPLNAKDYFDQGYNYGEQGFYEKSISCYKEAIALKSDFETAWNNLGWSYEKLGDIQNAIDAYKRAVAIESTVLTWKHLVCCYATIENVSGCQDALHHLEELNSDDTGFLKVGNANFWRNVAVAEFEEGRNYGQQGLYDKAILSYKKAVMLKSDFWEGWNNIGWAYGMLGDKQSAVEAYKKAAVAKYPDLGVLNSEINREFRRAYAACQNVEPNYVNSPEWPMKLADEASTNIKSSKLKVDGKDFIWKGVMYEVPRDQWPRLNAKRKEISEKTAILEKFNKQLSVIRDSNPSTSAQKQSQLTDECAKLSADRDKMASELDQLLSSEALPR